MTEEIKKLQNMLDYFGFVTVMNAHVIKLNSNTVYGGKLTVNSFNNNCICGLDTLKISNITESGPKKEFKAGVFSIPVARQGKEVKIEIKDALGSVKKLKTFFNLKSPTNGTDTDEEILYSDNSFAEPIAITGEMKIANTKGQIETIYLFIPFLLPQSQLTITQDAEGEFGVFDLSGQLYPVFLEEEKNGKRTSHMEYYSMRSVPFLQTTAPTDVEGSEYIYDGDTVFIYSALEEEGSVFAGNKIYGNEQIHINLL